MIANARPATADQPAPAVSASAGTGLFDFFKHHGAWAPGVRLFRRVDFKAKAAFISAVFAVPIAFLSCHFFVDGQHARDASVLELSGIEALRHTDALLADLRVQRLALMSGASRKPELAGAAAELGQVRAAAARLTDGEGLKTVEAAYTALQAAPAPVDDQLVQACIDGVSSLANDLSDGSGLTRDPEVDGYYLQNIVNDVLPTALEALSNAQALAAQYAAQSVTPEGASAHQLFAMTYFAAKHLMEVQAMMDRVRSANPDGAERVKVKDGMELVWSFAANANAAWFGDTFVGTSAELKSGSEQAMKGMQAIRDQAREVLVDTLHARIARIDRDRYVVGAVLVLTICLGVYLFYSFFLVMSGGLGEVRRHLVAMTQGDLTTTPRPWGKDEAADLMVTLKKMQDSLRSIVSRVRGSSEAIVNASGEIASASQDLSGRTELTAANLESSASSIDQVSVTVTQTAHNSQAAAEVAQNNARVAQQGGQVIEQVVRTMQDIQTSSRSIAEIIGTIDGIAFQTNILALNAAVEAARAGDQGRGFAVVASEVRSLAQRCTSAAREIKVLIGSSVERVEAGTRVVEGAGQTMKALVVNAQRMDELLSSISAASTEQSRGVSQVSQSVNELDRMTQQNAALVEQTTAAATSLKARAHEMANEVAQFRLERVGPEP